MKLIVGLGNPGKEYEKTRHNVGFIIVDNYLPAAKWKKTNDAMEMVTTVAGEKVCFLKPLTFMNLSGHAVSKIANYYKIASEDILVIHDDLDLPMQTYRLKFGTSSGGHNGIKSIIECLGTSNFAHLKIGIGRNEHIDTKNYVLSKLSNDEIIALKSEIYHKIIDYFIENGIDKAMNKYNTRI